MEQIKVILADDHRLILDGLKSLLETTPQLKIIAEAENGSQLVDYCRLLKPNLILTDVDMPIMGGIEAVQILRKEFPELKILVLSMHQDRGIYNRMRDAGANGYIHKNIDKEELLFAIHKVMSGKEYLSSEIIDKPKSIHSTSVEIQENLTRREIEILTHIAQGMTNIEIGEKLFISDRTVDTHRTNLMRKLHVNNVAGLVRYAYSTKLVD